MGEVFRIPFMTLNVNEQPWTTYSEDEKEYVRKFVSAHGLDPATVFQVEFGEGEMRVGIYHGPSPHLEGECEGEALSWNGGQPEVCRRYRTVEYKIPVTVP